MKVFEPLLRNRKKIMNIGHDLANFVYNLTVIEYKGRVVVPRSTQSFSSLSSIDLKIERLLRQTDLLLLLSALMHFSYV